MSTENNNKRVALEYLGHKLLSATVDHHVSVMNDNSSSKENVFSIYQDFNITKLLRSPETLSTARSIINHVLIPGYKEGKITPEQIKANLTYTTADNRTLNAAEFLLILDKKFTQENFPKENDYINSLLSVIKTSLNIQPSETFKLDLERSNLGRTNHRSGGTMVLNQ